MRKQPTAEQKQAAAERRARMRALAANIAKLTDLQRAELARLHPIATIEGRALSPRNQCMIAMQNPRASIVGGFRQWLKAGRAVRKGESGACIWIPLHCANGQADAPAAEGQEGEGVDGSKASFGLATVFDVSQTEEKGAEQS